MWTTREQPCIECFHKKQIQLQALELEMKSVTWIVCKKRPRRRQRRLQLCAAVTRAQEANENDAASGGEGAANLMLFPSSRLNGRFAWSDASNTQEAAASSR